MKCCSTLISIQRREKSFTARPCQSANCDALNKRPAPRQIDGSDPRETDISGAIKARKHKKIAPFIRCRCRDAPTKDERHWTDDEEFFILLRSGDEPLDRFHRKQTTASPAMTTLISQILNAESINKRMKGALKTGRKKKRKEATARYGLYTYRVRSSQLFYSRSACQGRAGLVAFARLISNECKKAN